MEPKYRNGKTAKHPNGHPWSSPSIPPRTIDDFSHKAPFGKYFRVRTRDLFEELADWWKDLGGDERIPERFRGFKTVPRDEWDSGKRPETELKKQNDRGIQSHLREVRERNERE